VYADHPPDRMRSPEHLAEELQEVRLPAMLRRFLHDQLYGSDYEGDILLEDCPVIYGNVALHLSARATFFSPSDPSGISGMHQQMIRSNPSFRGRPRFDTVLVKIGEQDGFAGMAVARVLAFLVFKHEGVSYECCYVEWFRRRSDEPDPVTGYWVVEPDLDAQGQRCTDIIHIDCVVRPCHLIGECGDERLPRDLSDSSVVLDVFSSFYVNHYIDYHAHECTR
jgi:hypothetical protein